MQLNGFMRDTIDFTQLWNTNKGGPANPLNGECGKVRQWGFCTKAKAEGNPPPPTDIVSTVAFVSFHSDVLDLIAWLSQKQRPGFSGWLQ